MELGKSFQFNKILFKIFGMWPEKGQYSAIYLTYAIILHVVLTLMFMVPLWCEVFLVDDLAQITQLSNMGLTELALLIKMVLMIKNIKLVQHLVEMFDDPEYQPKIHVEKQATTKLVSTLIKFMFAYYISTTLGMIMGITGPLQAPVNVLPFYQWFFGFDWHKSQRRFHILYVYQSIALSMHACLNQMIDLFLPFYFNFAVIQCELIGNRLSKLDSTNLKFREDLVKNIQHHVKMLEYCESAVNCFSFPTFIQYCLSGFVICFNAYQISIISPSQNPFGFFYMTFYTFSMLQQIFYSCYYGNEIVLKYKDLGSKLFHSNWLAVSVKYKHKIKFFLMKSNMVRNYKAWDSITINLGTFTKIVHTSYSLYALLKNRN